MLRMNDKSEFLYDDPPNPYARTMAVDVSKMREKALYAHEAELRVRIRKLWAMREASRCPSR